MRIAAILGLCVCLHVSTGAVGSKESRREFRRWKRAHRDSEARRKSEVLESWGDTWRRHKDRWAARRAARRYTNYEDEEAGNKVESVESAMAKMERRILMDSMRQHKEGIIHERESETRKELLDKRDEVERLQSENTHLQSENRRLQSENRQLQKEREHLERNVAWQRAKLEDLHMSHSACFAAAKTEEACLESVDRLIAGAAAESNKTDKEEDAGVKSECRGPGLVELLMLFMGYKLIMMVSDKDNGQAKEATLVNEEQPAASVPQAVSHPQDEEDEEMPEAPREEEPAAPAELLQDEEPDEEEEDDAPAPPEVPDVAPQDAIGEEDAQVTDTTPDADEDHEEDDGDRSVMSDESFELVP